MKITLIQCVQADRGKAISYGRMATNDNTNFIVTCSTVRWVERDHQYTRPSWLHTLWTHTSVASL